MRILVATAGTLFADAPRAALAERLVAALLQHRPHDAVDLLRLPRSAGLPLAARLSDVTAGSDRLVALDGEAALLPHPHLRLWLDAGAASGLDALAVGRTTLRCWAQSPSLAARLAEPGASVEVLPVPVEPPSHRAWAAVVDRLAA